MGLAERFGRPVARTETGRISPRAIRLLACALLALAAACKDDPTEPRTQYRLAIQGGDGQYGTAGATLEDPFQVQVTSVRSERAAVGVRVTWRIREGGSGSGFVEQSATTDSIGIASATLRLGTAVGEYQIEAIVSNLLGPPAVFTARAVNRPEISAVTPASAVAGDTVAIQGQNFSPTPDENTVTFAGVRGAVLSASATSLTAVVPACLPSRSAQVVVRLGAVASPAVTLPVEAASVSVLSLAPGEGRLLLEAAQAGCARLDVPAGSAFLLVPQNASDAIGERVPFVLTSLTGGAASAAPFALRAYDLGSAEPPEDVALRFESGLRLRERMLPRASFVRADDGAHARVVAPPEVGDRKQFHVVNREERFTKITAEVMYVSSRGVIYQDVKAPAGGFTAADFQRMGQLFDDPIYPTVAGAFGEPSDIDGNGRVTILFTPIINELTPRNSASFIAGYFYGYDLTTQPSSNRAEIFYSLVPDPEGKHGDIRNKQRILEIVPPVLAHELQHMVHFNQRVLRFDVAQESLWLSEALAHHAEELVGDALEARGDHSLARDFRISNYIRAGEYLRDPSRISIIAGVAPGSLAQRGGAWLFLKYITEHYGGATLLRRLTQTTESSVQNVVAQTGRSWSSLFGNWSIAIWADDAPELSGVAVDPLHTIPDLNLRQQLSPIGFTLAPLRVAVGDFAVNGALHAGSAEHLLLEAGSTAAIVNLSLTRKYAEPFRTDETGQLSLLRVR